MSSKLHDVIGEFEDLDVRTAALEKLLDLYHEHNKEAGAAG